MNDLLIEYESQSIDIRKFSQIQEKVRALIVQLPYRIGVNDDRLTINQHQPFPDIWQQQTRKISQTS